MAAGNGNQENGSSHYETSPIAIVGLSCKFGGDASSAHKLWKMVAEGRSGWSTYPESRFDAASWYHPDRERAGRNHARGGHFLEQDLGLFDAAFFDLPAEMASCIDPQIRLVLEAVYEAVENAGIPMDKLSGSNTGVFSGVYTRDYHESLTRDPEVAPSSLPVGSGAAMMSNRVSHFFDFRGASVSSDTGCSSGVVVLHQAVTSLRNQESETAIVSASSINLNPDMFVFLSTRGLIGADGKVYAWDDRADGYARGEGVASFVLKPLDAALRDGDNVRAIIRETALNQDGRTTTITSPSATAQEKLIRDCYARAGLNIADTCYVEAHMTGTLAGDKTEASALGATFGQSRRENGLSPIVVGGVKTNIGHTEPVSGLAALVKAVYMLENQQIPPNVNYKNGNPNIPLQDWHLKVPTELSEWPENAIKRVSVNNFGYGGTNAHVILDQAPKAQKAIEASEPAGHNSHLFVISAKDAVAASNMTQKLAEFIDESLESESPISKVDLAYSLSEKRALLPSVIALSAPSLTDLVEQLKSPATKPAQVSQTPSIGFIFNGQGAQWHAMGRELISSYQVFHDSIQSAKAILKDLGASWSLTEELNRDAKETRVGEMHISQPISVSLQICLVDLLSSWGIKPSAVTSHSSGEIAAAYAVGALSFKEAIGAAFYRGEIALQFHEQIKLNGGMLAAGLGADEAKTYLSTLTKGRVVVACVNSPESVTLSGDMDGIDEIEAILKEKSIFARKLKVPLAYHSHHMQHMAQSYEEKLNELLGPSETRTWNDTAFYSPVTGALLKTPQELENSHWVKNLVSPVLFSQSFDAMVFDEGSNKAKLDIILEVGAHGTLAGPVRQIAKTRTPTPLPYVSCLNRGTDAVQTMQELAAFLVSRGAPLNIKAVNSIINDQEPQFISEMPTYAWNHTRRYWLEPRLNKELRYPGGRPHELLGMRAAGSVGYNPTWRTILRLSDLPWLQDHQLEGNAILPGAGYVSMAIEAVRRVIDVSEETITGYKLRDIDIINALTIPEDNALEVQLVLRPCDDKQLDHDNWYEFELYSCGESDNWTKHGKGYVQAELKKTFTPLKVPDASKFFGDEKPQDVDPEDVFANLRSMNFYHGPQFQNLLNIKSGKGKAITDLRLAPFITEDDDYVMHPTTLDSIIVASYNVMDPEGTPNSTVVPRGIRSMYVAKTTPRSGAKELESFTKIVKQTRRGFETSATIREAGSTEACIIINGLSYQAIPRAPSSDSNDKEPVMLFQNVWEFDTTRNVPQSIKDSLKIEIDEEQSALQKKHDRAAYYVISSAIAQLDGSNVEDWEFHHQQLFGWMKSIVSAADSNQLSPGSRSWSKTSEGLRKRLLDEVAASGRPGSLLVEIGTRLADIVSGQIKVADIVENGLIAKQYYQESAAARRARSQLKKAIQLYAAKNPSAKVLELGGHATTTATVLAAAQNEKLPGVSLFSQYDFTDITSNSFEDAKKELARWDSSLDFKVLDINQDLAGQSFEEASYDLVVSVLALHDTHNIAESLANIKKLLKPQGQLILVAPTKSHLATQLALGVLPGSWPENNESGKPSVISSHSEWVEALEETGFSEPQLELYDCEDGQQSSLSLILATSSSEAAYPSSISIVHAGTPPPQEWTSKVQEDLRKVTGVQIGLESLTDVDVTNKVCVVVAEVDRPLIDSLDGDSFSKIQNLLLNSRGVMWLTAGGLIDGEVPHLAQFQGMMRTLKQEDASVRRIHLDFSSGSEKWSSDNIPFVTQVFEQSFNLNVDDTTVENEYAVKDSALRIPRVYHDLSRDKRTSKTQNEIEPVLKEWHHPNSALIWERGISGILTQTHFVDTPLVPQVPENHVEIESRAFGLNFRDVLLALGQLDETHLAHESCGVITRIGPNTEGCDLQVGDRVACMAPVFGSKIITRWTNCAKIPESMTFEQGASVVASYVTGWLGLVDVARLSKGETILIHAATGAAGQAAIMLAQHIGADIYTTCGTEAKREFLRTHYGIPDDRIFSSRDESFLHDVMAATNGEGVDVVYNSLAGDLLKRSWECLGRFGRFIEIGKIDMEAARRIEMTPFTRMGSFTGIDVIQVSKFRPFKWNNALKQSLKLFGEGRVKAVAPITTFPISEMESAMRVMQSGGHMGKLVLIPHPEDKIKVVSPRRPVELSGEQTYLVAGNVAGIGRSISNWMIERGAKNIVLLSRSAEKHPEMPALIQQSAEKGSKLLARNCDISNQESVSQLAAYCAENLPPVGGIVVAAMVLDDTVMESLTYEQWHRGIMPKVAGSWNLHKHFNDLNFFTMLSSIVGVVGNASQATYGAGNAFQDALAKHRTSLGLPAASLDLGAVLEVGYAAEAGKTVMNNVGKLGTMPIDMDHVMRIIEATIQEPLSPANALEQSQYITAITPYESIPEEAVIKNDRRFTTLKSSGNEAAGAADGAASSNAVLKKALASGNLTKAEGAPLITAALMDKLADTFSIEVETMDPTLPLSKYGVDSLVAVELRNWLSGTVKAKVTIFEILQSPSLNEFSVFAAGKSELLKEA